MRHEVFAYMAHELCETLSESRTHCAKPHTKMRPEQYSYMGQILYESLYE
eukprot:CAMPEP_0179461186 /NCGR_PEP_ID=MMETSP0799-20121207/43989_1 /TAXON_ID=46947 /ORGANISM="Geminigera cryophila, Strain CCMP2564" /LENGTH=49 /DNA_ID=CAMNT_0021263691 /DNA_START=184 /DNA_END=333 /DNA_ORIENTATION=+